MDNQASLRTGPATSFWDRVFESQINGAIEKTKAFYAR
jgi:hypothetical protein